MRCRVAPPAWPIHRLLPGLPALRVLLAGGALLAAFPVPAVQVRSVSPSGEVDEVQQVQLRFDAPVVPFGSGRLADPATLLCQGLGLGLGPGRGAAASSASATATSRTPPGSGRWTGPAEWVYDLNEPLGAGVSCRLAIRPDWAPVVAVRPLGPAASGQEATGAGASLQGTREFTFSTGGPAVQQVSPWEGSEVEEEGHFLLRLSGPVEVASLAGRAACEVQGLGERLPVVVVEGAPREAVLKSRRIPAAQAQRHLLLRCQRPLPPGATVRLVWGAGIAAAGAPQLVTRGTKSWQWTVRQRFSAEFSCERERAEAPCLPLRPMRLVFSAPVPRAQAQAARLVPLGPIGQLGPASAASAAASQGLVPKLEDAGPTVSQIVFAAPLAENTRYQLTLPAGLRDETGRELANAAAFPLATATGPMPPLAKFAAAPFGVVEAGSAGEPALLPITLRHVQALAPGLDGTAQLAAKRLGADTADAELMRWHARLARWHESSFTAKEAGQPQARWWLEGRDEDGKPQRQERRVGSRELSLLAGESGVTRTPLPRPPSAAASVAAAASAAVAAPVRDTEVLGLPLPQPGYHLLELESRLLGRALLAEPAPMYVRSGVLVTRMGVHFKRGRSSSLVWVTSLDRARPVVGADVAVSDCRGQSLWSGRTDAQGLARIPRGFADEDGERCIGEAAYFVSARKAWPDGVRDLAFVYSHWMRGIEPWRFGLATASGVEPELRAHSVLDRSLLRAGETLSMKHVLRAETERGLALLNASDWPTELQITHVGSGEVTRLALPALPALPTPPAGAASAAAEQAPLRSVSMQWTVPAQARLGEYELSLHRGARQWSSGRFRVEAFRVPLVDARLSPPKGPLVAPGALDFAVQLNHMAGGGLATAASFSALLREREVAPAGWEEYSFNAPRERDQNAPANRPEGEEGASAAPSGGVLLADRLALRTNPQGAATVTLPRQAALTRLKRPAELLAELSFDDPNGERQTVSQTLPVWPATLQLGLKARSWLAQRGQVPLQVVALDTAGKPRSGQFVELRARRIQLLSHRQRVVGGFYAYEDRQEVQDLGPVCKGKTDARGLLTCDALLQAAGEVELIARASDEAGRTVETATSVWISGSGEQWFAQDNDDRIDLIPEKRELQPGDTARLQVRMPFREATVLLTVEREGILHSQVLTLRGSDPVIELPIPKGGAGKDGAEAWAPNVYVSALVLRGRLREVPWYSFFQWGWRAPLDWWNAWRREAPDHQPPTAMVDLAKPAFKLGVAQLHIGLASQRLEVQVTSDKPQYGPRQTARATVVVTQDGKPVSGGEIAFAAVDEGLLALSPNGSWDLLEQMYPPRAWGVETATAQNEIVGRRHYGRKALPPGGGGGRNPTRELFDTLLLWRPVVRLDAQGRATLDVPLNDSLTRFRLVAVADAGADRFGSGSTTLTVSQDLQLIAGLPPVVRSGDRFEAQLTLRNTTAAATWLEVKLEATPTPDGDADLQQAGTAAAAAARGAAPGTGTPPTTAPPLSLAPQRVEVPAQSAVELRWPVTVPAQVRALAWEASAVESTRSGGTPLNPKRDALRLIQRVEPALPLRVQQASLQQLDSSLALPVQRPAGAAPGGGVVVALQPRLAGALPGMRRWFEAYPYSCLEQRASRAVGLRDLPAWQQLLRELPGYLDGDGLAHYFPPRPEEATGGGSDRLSAYLLSLSDAAGWPLPPDLRDRLLDGLGAFVEGRLERPGPAPRSDRDVRKLAALEALSRHGRALPRHLGSLEITPTQWPTSALLDWQALLQRVDSLPQREQRLEEATRLLRARLSSAGSTLRFVDEAGDRWSWLMEGPDANAARLLLMALQTPAWQDDAPRLAQGLLLRLHGGDGPQRQLAAGSTAGAFNTTTANVWATLAFEQFSLRRESQAVTGLTRAQLGSASGELDWGRRPDGGRLLLPWPAQSATLQVTQQGSGRPWLAIQSLAATAPVTVAAGYRLERSATPVEQKVSGLWSRGDVLRVRLTVDASADLGWVVLSDPVPAGATLLGSGLGRDSRIAQRTTTPESGGNAWLAWEERRPDAWRAYYRWMPRGRHTVEYTLRLNTVGQFQLPPTRVEAMYAPENHAELPLPALVVQR
jgi:uncharacterized protein YfaS (alpha-2-macroglobulin family)